MNTIYYILLFFSIIFSNYYFIYFLDKYLYAYYICELVFNFSVYINYERIAARERQA